MPQNEKKTANTGLREKLIKAAAKIIDQQGVEKVSMRTLGQMIGVSRMAAYRHFANKNELLCAIAEDGFKLLKKRFESIPVEPDDTPLDRFYKIGVTYIEFALENPDFYRLMYGREIIKQDRTQTLQEAAAIAFADVLMVVDNCKENKLMIPKDTMAITTASWAMAHGIACLIIDSQLQTDSKIGSYPTLLKNEQTVITEEIKNLIHFAMKIVLDGVSQR